MNIIKKTLLLMAFAIVAAGASAAGVKLSKLQKDLQQEVLNHMLNNGISASVDNEDQSVTYSINGENYFITFEKADKNIYYIHRYSFNLEGKNKRVAVMAANEVNKKSDIKSYVKGNEVYLIMPVYAIDAFSFCNVFPIATEAFKGVSQIFKDSYYELEKNESKGSKNIVDELGGNQGKPQKSSQGFTIGKGNNGPAVGGKGVIVIAQDNPVLQDERCLSISKFELCSVDKQGEVLINYNDNIRKAKTQFVKARVNVESTQPGNFRLGIRIYNPNGKLMLPSQDAAFTTVTPVSFSKAGKSQTIELYKFGSSDSSLWIPGEYTIELYDGNIIIDKYSFNVL